jgi:outer membrane protein TolC
VARPLILLAALLTAGCFKAPMVTAQRSLSTWREMQAVDTRSEPGARPDAPAPGAPLTSDQAYALALRRNPDLAVAEAEVDVAEAEIGATKQLENPTLRLTNFQIDEAVAGRPGMNLGLRAPIPRPGSVQARAAQARLIAEGAESRAEAARRRLRVDIRRHFAQLAFYTADLDELTRAVELADKRVQQLRGRVDQAVATRVDLSLAEVERAELLDEQSRVRGELARAESALTLLVSPGAAHTFVVDRAELDIPDVALDRAALTDKAVGARQELRETQTRTGEAQAEEYLARNEAWPWLAWAQVNYQFRAASSTAMTTSTPAFGFGLALDIPLFSLNLRKIKAAKAVVRQRQLEERAAVAQVAAEVAAAMARVAQADARVREIEASLLPQLEAAARHAEAALNAGGLDAIKALEIADRQVAARRVHLEALYERRAAVLGLEAALGAAP